MSSMYNQNPNLTKNFDNFLGSKFYLDHSKFLTKFINNHTYPCPGSACFEKELPGYHINPLTGKSHTL